MRASLLLLLLPGLGGAALAHPGADEELRASEVPLAVEPCNTELWLTRARALGAERRTAEALAAVDRAEACGVGPAVAALTRGVALADAGRPIDALPHLDAAVAHDPAHAGARLVRGGALAAVGRPAEAAADLEQALARIAEPQPDDVLRLARIYRELGDEERALRVLDRARPSPALVEEAVAIELLLGRPEGALGRIDAMPASPYWLLKRADVQERSE